MDNTTLRERAIALRRNGYLYGQIATELQIAKSTAYVWTKDLLLTGNAQVVMAKALTGARQRAVTTMMNANVRARAKQLEDLVQEADEIVKNVTIDINTQKILCAVMFWCEGEKDVSGGVRFINSDPLMMRSFLTLLRSGFTIDETRFRALLHLHDYHDEKKQLAFWSETTDISVAQFHKSYRKPYTGKNIHAGYPGCLSVRYGDAKLAKLLKMIYSSLGDSLGA
jgi:hypothetical protein